MHILEGELVRDWWEYEYDDLELDGRGLTELITELLGPGRVEEDGRTRSRTYLGRVRIVIQPL